MSIEVVREYLKGFGYEDRVIEFQVSSATVELAAKALGVNGQRIAKSMAFKIEDRAIMIIAAGDVKIDNSKFKAEFHTKAKMLAFEEVLPLTGHPVGGVCPFAVEDSLKVYLDESLKRFDIVYPAAGTPASAVKLSPDELFQCSRAVSWVDVTKFV